METRTTAEKRRSARHPVKNSVFVAFRPNFQKLGWIVNISKGGVAFEYVSQAKPEEADDIEVDIFSREKDVYIKRIPCKVVYDSGLNGNRPSIMLIETRRCGLEFRDLSHQQAGQIRSLLAARN